VIRRAPLLLTAALLATSATPAEAGGVFFAILGAGGGLGAAFTATTIGGWLTGNIIGRMVASVIISSLQAALARLTARKQAAPGIRAKVAGTGGLNPRSFILGTFATTGTRVQPDNAYAGGSAPNYWLTQVIDLCDIQGAEWLRVAIDGTWTQIDPGGPVDGWSGSSFTGKYSGGNTRILLRTGAETVSDARLLSVYGADPDRPWTADMIGRGIVTAIMTFAANPRLYNGLPVCRHEVRGIKLYDPRNDPSVGGVGTQSFLTPSTWGYRDNPAVEIYNVMRGITLDALGTWGGRIGAADLPVTNWVAAMNVCDVSYPILSGGSEPRYRAHAEVKVTDPPNETLADLLVACNGEMADCGGTWKIRVGEPGLPVYFFTDSDVLITLPEELDPFPQSEAVINGLRPVHTSPIALYEPVQGALITDAAWVAADGQENFTELPLAAVTSETQAQRVTRAELYANRRWRTHRVPLPPDAMVLEPLDVVSWTSTRNGYLGKLFEVTEVEDIAETMQIVVSLREIDPEDYDWSTDKQQPSHATPPGATPPATFIPAAPTLSITAQTDATGSARRRSLRLNWAGAELAGKGLEYEVRRQGETALLCSGAVLDATSGSATVAADLLPGATYEGRFRLWSITPQGWSAWASITVPARRTVGSAALTALGVAKTVTNALTTFDPVATVSVTDAAFTGQEAGFAKVQCSLSGATSAKLVWRQIARQTPSGGSYTVFERIEELTSGRTLILSGGGSVAAPWTAFDVVTEVSGELLPGGATVTITHCANQFITPHA
jgi:hypothetical protein